MIRKRKLQPKGNPPTIFAYHDGESAGAIEFRRLARNIRHRGNPGANAGARSILVTSAAKHEGKSLISANLAIAMAERESDKKVLLIDCDLRRPMIHSLFGLKREPGLVSLLAGASAPSDEANASATALEPVDVAHDTELDNLKVIAVGQNAFTKAVADKPAGADASDSLGSVRSPRRPSPISASKLLANAKDILDKCKEQFDILICDAPPVVPVDDVGVISLHVDGVLLVVLAGKTDRMVVKRAVDMLHEVDAEVLGIALNNMHGVLPYYYDYGYYRYKYEKEEVARSSL
jgi:Mrp family chromosome partitioning ATPase